MQSKLQLIIMLIEIIVYAILEACYQFANHSLDGADKMFPVLLVRSGDSRMAIHVEATLGNREIVVKPLAAQLSRLPCCFRRNHPW